MYMLLHNAHTWYYGAISFFSASVVFKTGSQKSMQLKLIYMQGKAMNFLWELNSKNQMVVVAREKSSFIMQRWAD